MKKIRNLLVNLATLLNVFFFKKKFKKIIFFHTPQSGGNSIHYFFKLNLGFRGFGLEDDDLPLENSFYDKFLYIYGHFGLDRMKNKEFRKDYFYLFNIRNPKNRYLSNYYRNKELYQKENKQFISLEDFLKLRLSQNADNYYTRYLSGETIIEDNTKVSKEVFNKALSNLDKISFYFILEESEKSFKKLKQNLNIKFPFSDFFVLHKNKVSGSKYPNILDKERDLLEELTHYDTQIYEKILLLNQKIKT